MILVSDTSPLHYLLLIDQIDLLPQLFQQIIIPDVVRDELLVPSTPLVIQQWIANSPPWLNTQAVPELDETLNSLDPGEQAAISLAQTLPTDFQLNKQSPRLSSVGCSVVGFSPGQFFP